MSTVLELAGQFWSNRLPTVIFQLAKKPMSCALTRLVCLIKDNCDMRFTRSLAVLALSILCSAATADTLKDTVEARSLTDRIMAKVGTGDVVGRITLAQPYMIVPPAEFDVMINQLKMQEPVMAQRFGKTVGHEFLREEKVGQSLLRIVQLHRFEKHAMRWNFYFYRGSSGWVLNTFKTDDDVSRLFAD